MHIVVEPRLVRRVIKAERNIVGLGRHVPHRASWVVERARLLELVSARELGVDGASLPPRVALIARPDSRGDDAVLDVAREAFHASVHRALDERLATKLLGPREARARAHRIGQTEFDEVRAVLRGEDRLGDGADDVAVYVEFAATWLELARHDPDALAALFPTLRDRDRVASTLALDVDAEALAAAAGPPPRRRSRPPPARSSLLPWRRDARPEDAPRLLADAEAQRASGNHARAAISTVQAGASPDEDVARLAARLRAAVAAPPDDPRLAAGELEATLRSLVDVAARTASLRPVEARILHDLTKACVDREVPRKTVDVVTWATSAFSRPIVRVLPAVSVVRAVRHLRRALEESHRARVDDAARARLEAVFHAAIAAAERNARDELGAAIRRSLREVGLAPASVPEAVAEDKLVAELIDRILERGFIGLSALRDAISRNNLKLPRLRGPAELVLGDPLLALDRLLARRIDGVYRSGEIYLRLLQKASSVAFGTALGRVLTSHVALPLLAAFTLLEGLQHVVGPLAKKLAHAQVHLLGLESFIGVSLYLYLLIHVPRVRSLSSAAIVAVGRGLHAAFIDLPTAVLTSRVVLAVVRSRPFSLLGKPLLVGAPAYLVARHHVEPREALLVAAGLFAALATLLGTAVGARLEEAAVDGGGRLVRALTRRLLPALLASVAELFKTLVERVDRALYAVDEWLTFRQGESAPTLWIKGALGLVWFFATYLVRVYVNLLIEPQVNPIKHFPVVTVSHKIILPFSPTLLRVFRAPLMPLGPVVANGVGGITVFLLPGIFGFLVWELKENWRLYAQNRARELEPVPIGHHGESMRGLLVPGFHSGTLPKLFAKLRRARSRGSSAAHTHREAIHEVEHAVSVFVQRELCGLLSRVSSWTAGPVEVARVAASSNRVAVDLALAARPDARLGLSFEEQSGWLVAGLGVRALLDALSDEDRARMEDAVAGLYKLAGVELVREQLSALVGGRPYDISDRGLVVWSSEACEQETVFDLAASGAIEGSPSGELPPLDGARAVFGRQSITYDAWQAAWRSDARVALTGPAVTSARGPRA